MDFDLQTIFIVLAFIFAAGFIDSIAGGGGIISITGFMIAGVPMHYALGTNKVQSLFGTAVSTYNYVKNKSYRFDFVIFCLVGSLIGAFFGSTVATMINQDVLKIVMSIVLVFVAIIILLKKKPKGSLLDLSKNKIFIITFFIGLTIGFYDGILGPGTGTFLIIAFTMCGLSMLEANGNSKIVNLGSNITAALVFIFHGKVLFWLAIPCIITNMLANYLGSKLAIKNGEKIVRPVLIFVLILLFVKMIVDVAI